MIIDFVSIKSIARPSGGDVAFPIRQTLGDMGDWAFAETDHASAYKNLAIVVSDMRFAYVANGRPISARMYEMRHNALLVGSSARYCVIMRLGGYSRRLRRAYYASRR